jgi:hypothetical protein
MNYDSLSDIYQVLEKRIFSKKVYNPTTKKIHDWMSYAPIRAFPQYPHNSIRNRIPDPPDFKKGQIPGLPNPSDPDWQITDLV